MNRFLLILFICCFQVAFAQFREVSMGPGYANQVFFSFSDTATYSHLNTSWDIAFEVFSQRDAGVFINEATGNSMSNPIPELEVFEVGMLSFEEVVDTSVLGQRLHNPDKSWNEGAFNTVKSPQNPFDFGWGTYEPTTNVVSGERVFVLKFRDSTYKKMEIQALDSGRYVFHYANLDGSGDTTQTLVRADYQGKTLAYFSFETESFLDLEPASWDLYLRAILLRWMQIALSSNTSLRVYFLEEEWK